MNLFKRLPGYQRTPYGMELRILRRLPWAMAACTLVPLLLVLLSQGFPPEGPAETVAKHLALMEILAIALAVTGWTLILTLAIGCIIVWVMKGPAYVADAYELIDFESPVTNSRARNPSQARHE